MTIGAGIVMIVIGAILAFAVEFDIAGIDIRIVGYILMAGGLAGLLFGLMSYRRRRSVYSAPATRPVEQRTIVEEQRDVY